jgi:putative ABC transport system ATP-binding protein
MRRLNEDFKKTIIMVTHDGKAAARSKRILHLEKGILVDELTADEFVKGKA